LQKTNKLLINLMKIKRIEIKNLWGQDIKWELKNDVNILVGNNGSGKSTILKMLNVAFSLKDIDENLKIFNYVEKMIIELDDETIIQINSEEVKISNFKNINNFKNRNLSYINTFDTPMSLGNNSETLLDFLLTSKDGLKNKFILYQRNLSKLVEQIFTKNENSEDKFNKIEKIYQAKNIFIRQINTLFKETGKIFDEENFNFKKDDNINSMEIEKLSSGEKQIFIILLTVLLQDQKQFVLILDEPEISLHIDWQRILIDYILELNPNCQIIIATHSPTIFYKGYDTKMQRISKICTPTDLSKQSSIILEQINKIPNRLELVQQQFDSILAKPQPQLYDFNIVLNQIPTFTIDDCYEIIKILVQNNIQPDVFTFTTLISKVNSFDEAENLYISMKNYNIKPNEHAYNNLLKKSPM